MGLDMYLYRTKALNKDEKETVKSLLGESKPGQVFLKSEVAYWHNAHPVDRFLNPDGEERSVEVSINTLRRLRDRCDRVLAILELQPATDDNGVKYMAITNKELCDEYLPGTGAYKFLDGARYKHLLQDTITMLDPILNDPSNYSSDVWFNYESDY